MLLGLSWGLEPLSVLLTRLVNFSLMEHMHVLLPALSLPLLNLLWPSRNLRLESALLGCFFDCLHISLLDASFEETCLLHFFMVRLHNLWQLPLLNHGQMLVPLYVLLNLRLRYIVSLTDLSHETLQGFSLVDEKHEVNQDSWVNKVKEKAVNWVPDLKGKFKLGVVSVLFSGLEGTLRAVLSLLFFIVANERSDLHLVEDF